MILIFTDFPWHQRVQDTLKTVFKLDTFRSQQLAAINITLSKHDAILIMPTGGGKSLCYQLPALIDQGIYLTIMIYINAFCVFVICFHSLLNCFHKVTQSI